VLDGTEAQRAHEVCTAYTTAVEAAAGPRAQCASCFRQLDMAVRYLFTGRSVETYSSEHEIAQNGMKTLFSAFLSSERSIELAEVTPGTTLSGE